MMICEFIFFYINGFLNVFNLDMSDVRLSVFLTEDRTDGWDDTIDWDGRVG